MLNYAKNWWNIIKQKKIIIKKSKSFCRYNSDFNVGKFVIVQDLINVKYYNFLNAKIIIGAPGLEKGHILLSLTEDGRTLKVSIEINFINIEREIVLPYESTMDDHFL